MGRRGTELLLPGARIDRAAGRIEEIARDRVMGTALEIGRVVIDEIYDGDLDAWRTRGRNDPSFQQLGRILERRGRTVSRMTMYRACGLVELEDRLGVSTLLRLSASHGFAVLGLPGPVQEQLLTTAQQEQLSVRQLQALAAEQRPKRKAGRKSKPAFVKSLARFKKWVDDDGLEDLDEVASLGVIEAHQLLQTTRKLQAELAVVSARLKERVRGD